MSVLFYPGSIRILGSDTNGNNVMLCKMAVDDIANLPAANAFISDGYVLSMGCTATAINDNSKHRLNGGGNWVQIAAGTSTYTRAEIDAMQADLQNQIDYSINTGCKNIFSTNSTTQTIADVTFTNNNNGTWTVNGIALERRQKVLNFTVPNSLKQGTYILSGCPIGGIIGGAIAYCLYIWDITDGVRITSNDTGNGIAFNWTPDSTHAYSLSIDIRSGTNAQNLLFKPMIRSSSIKDASFEQFAPTNRQLYEMILQLQGG